MPAQPGAGGERSPSALDEYPIHQTPLSMRYVQTSDRNSYNRCYFNAHDGSGGLLLVTGLGVYPNLGVIDAYAAVKRGSSITAVRFSDLLTDDRLTQAVGPYRVDVLEPLHRLRVRCDADRADVAFDLEWTADSAAVLEPGHALRSGARAIIDTSRFAQVGSWRGTLWVDGSQVELDPGRWTGSRDRSWGVRPVGEPEPPGRAATEPPDGFWWLYAPLRFPDFAVVLIAQEGPDGFRSLNEALRVHADGRVEQLGWPRYTVSYRAGSRHPEAARIDATDGAGRPLRIDVRTRGGLPLHLGCGYSGDADWTHGRFLGPGWSQVRRYDLDDPAVAARAGFGVVDHVAQATIDGVAGSGLFEHGSLGRHDPSGFTGWTDVAR